MVRVIKALGSEDDVTGAFDIIIERYSERLYWHIRRIVVLSEDAEDTLQDTFVAAFKSAKDFRGDSESSLTAWLYKIATISIKCLRRRKRHICTSIDSLTGGACGGL